LRFNRKARRALARLRSVSLKLTLTGTDAGGTRTVLSRPVRLKR